MTAILIIQSIILLALVAYFVFDKSKSDNKNNDETEEASKNQQLLNEKFNQIQLELARTINEVSEKETRARENIKDSMLKQLSNVNQQMATQQRDLITSDISKSKEILDTKLNEVDKKLRQVSQTILDVEKNNSTRHGAMDKEIKQQMDAMSKLTDTTNQLKETLSSTKNRGQWGERLAEDVLQLAGFTENVNYTKQTTITSHVEANQRPDFTFFLPNNTKLYMDVKFPLESFTKMTETKDENLKKSYQKQFVSDIKKHIKDLKQRGYHQNEDSIPSVLMFIPNEQIFTAINEAEYGLVDQALRDGVILCSPLTLFAVLAVFRQGAEMFRIENASRDLFKAVKEFENEWNKYDDKYRDSIARFNKSIREFETLTGTRQNQLEKKMGKVISIGNEVEAKELRDFDQKELGTS